jgi:hypothetical protein
MKSLFLYFKKIDFLGPQIGFEYEDSNTYRTTQGAIYSLITFVAAIVITLMFGRELYERKNPIVSENKEFIPESKVYFKDFPVLFSFHYGDTTQVENPNDFYDFFIESYTIDSQSKILVNRNYMLNKCQPDSFTSNKDLVKNLISNTSFNYYCFSTNDNDYFSNDLGSPDSSYFRIYIQFCDNSNPLRDCKMIPQLDAVKGLVIVTSFVNNVVDSTNYDNPVTPYVDRFVQPISSGLFKLLNFRISSNLYVSDNGWMLEEKRNIVYYKKDEVSTDINLMDFNFAKYVYSAVFESPRLRSKTQRSYMKIQELLARVAGVAKLFTLIITLFTYDHIRFLYLMFIRKSSLEKFNERSKFNKSSKEEVDNLIFNNYKYNSNKDLNSGNKNSNNLQKKTIEDVKYQENIYASNKNCSINNISKKSLLEENKNIKNTDKNELKLNNLILPNQNLEANQDNPDKNNKQDVEKSNSGKNVLHDAKININLKNIGYENISSIKPNLSLIKLTEKEEVNNNNNTLRYYKYFSVRFCRCFINNQTINLYKFEIEKVNKMLDIKNFF